MSSTDVLRRPVLAHTIRRLSVPILLFWVALAAITNIAVPNLEDVGKAIELLSVPSALLHRVAWPYDSECRRANQVTSRPSMTTSSRSTISKKAAS
jgi:hypothetical protein